METMKNSSTLQNNSISALAIGGFDGMHVAHQKLFSSLGKNGAIIVIVTGYANLTPKINREDYTSYPIDYYELEDVKHLNGPNFISLLKNKYPNLKKIVVGFDFCFGANRKYCIPELNKLFDGEVLVIPEVCIDNIPVHSRTIREYLEKGEIKTANEFLGHKYKIKGSQIKGQGLGSKSFVPTINIEIKEFKVPNEGVYITKTRVDNVWHNSVTFLGHRVTTDNSYAIETHIISKKLTNHHDKVEIEFHDKIRGNKKFNSFEDLKNEIIKDIEFSKSYFKN